MQISRGRLRIFGTVEYRQERIIGRLLENGYDGVKSIELENGLMNHEEGFEKRLDFLKE